MNRPVRFTWMPPMTDAVATPAETRHSGSRRTSGRPNRFGKRREPIFADNDVIDYKDVARLRRCLDERGRILPRRRLNHSAGVHRRVTVAIKQARHLALLPFVARDPRN